MANEKKTLADDAHRYRVSGISGRTAGKMHRQFRANPSSQHNTLRRKTQLQPRGRNRFPLGYKFTTMAGEPIPGC